MSKIYYFEKLIFRVAIFLVLLFWIAIILKYGFNDRIYVVCPENRGLCDNPLYNNCNLLRGDDPSILLALHYCEQEFLFPGTTIGEPPSWIFRNGWMVILGVMSVAFLVNHLLYNRPSQIRMRRMD